MASLDEDDLRDYAEEGYDDEEISPEDDEKIVRLIPQVKAQLKDHVGYTYDDVYNELWDSYLSVPEAVAQLKSK